MKVKLIIFNIKKQNDTGAWIKVWTIDHLFYKIRSRALLIDIDYEFNVQYTSTYSFIYLVYIYTYHLTNVCYNIKYTCTLNRLLNIHIVYWIHNLYIYLFSIHCMYMYVATMPVLHYYTGNRTTNKITSILQSSLYS